MSIPGVILPIQAKVVGYPLVFKTKMDFPPLENPFDYFFDFLQA